MDRLPTEETRLAGYARLMRERFGEAPKTLDEGHLLAEWDGATCGEQCLHTEHQGR
jgi:hypothetical protein